MQPDPLSPWWLAFDDPALTLEQVNAALRKYLDSSRWIAKACISRTNSATAKNGVIHAEVCNQCHPFYTGKQQRILDTAGRVERFNKKYAKKAA